MTGLPSLLVLAALLVACGSAWAARRSMRRPDRARPRPAYLVLGLLVVPVLALAGASSRMVAGMKAVDACGSCHVMDHFVSDMLDTASITLAARHFRADSMPREACYYCHTGYGLFGSVEAKKAGLSHWWKYLRRAWHEPIQIRGGYPNANCMACHPAEPMFADSIPLHVALQDSIMADVITCFMCHGEPHARHLPPDSIGIPPF